MKETLNQTSDAGDTFKQRMHETLYQTGDAEVSLSDIGCMRHSIRQRCRRHSMRQRMQKSLYRCVIECHLHPLSDRETSASAV